MLPPQQSGRKRYRALRSPASHHSAHAADPLAPAAQLAEDELPMKFSRLLREAQQPQPMAMMYTPTPQLMQPTAPPPMSPFTAPPPQQAIFVTQAAPEPQQGLPGNPQQSGMNLLLRQLHFERLQRAQQGHT